MEIEEPAGNDSDDSVVGLELALERARFAAAQGLGLSSHDRARLEADQRALPHA